MASFLLLSREIRDKCYEYVSGDALIVTSDRLHKAPLQLWRPRNEILQVSKQIRAEALRTYNVVLVHFSTWRPDLANLHRSELSDFMRSFVTFLLLNIQIIDFSGPNPLPPQTREALNLPSVREVVVRMDRGTAMHQLDLPYEPDERELQDALEAARIGPKSEEIVQIDWKHKVWKEIVAEVCSDTPVTPKSINFWKQTAVCRPQRPFVPNGSGRFEIMNNVVSKLFLGIFLSTFREVNSLTLYPLLQTIVWNHEANKPHARHWREKRTERPSSISEVKKECLTEGHCQICEILIYEIDVSHSQGELPLVLSKQRS